MLKHNILSALICVMFCLHFVKGKTACDKSSSPCGNMTCIPEARICNGVLDCSGGEDELDCGMSLNAFQTVLKHESRSISTLIIITCMGNSE